MTKILFILPAWLLVFDVADCFLAGYLSYIRGAILLSIVFMSYLNRKLRKDSIFYLMLLFLAYTFIISLQSSNYNVTIPGYLSIFVSMSFYLLSYNIITNYEDITKFKKLLYIIPAIFIINAFILAVFNIGEATYGGGLKTGSLHHNV